MKNRLLIISCSRRKNKFESLESAWKVYDGVMFRALRRIECDGKWPADLNVLILSSKFGLINPGFLISYYEQKMNPCRADELEYAVSYSLEDYINRKNLKEIVLSMGSEYLRVFKNVVWPPTLNVGVVPGRIGEKLNLTSRWIIDPRQIENRIQWLQVKDD